MNEKNQSFEQLFQQSLQGAKMRSGDVVSGMVIGIDDKFVLVNVGLKSEGVVPVVQFLNVDGTMDIKVGDKVDVVVESVADDFGETRLSREKAKRAESWAGLVRAFESGEKVVGLVLSKVKGGFTVDVQGVKAFLPGSLVDVRTVQDTSFLEGKSHEFKIIKVDEKRNNIVVSRRAVIEAESTAERSKLLEALQEGQIIEGVVKNLTDYGAFVDMGGMDGLLHNTDISWKRIKQPSEALKIGEKVKVIILKFDRERGRVSLGMKQLAQDPWVDIKSRYPKGTRMKGKVTNLTDYGCFVEIEEGVEGLVHMSEMDWTNKNVHPSKLVQLGDEVEVLVLDIDEDRRRISLGMKQCVLNPWKEFSDKHQKGDRLVGAIKSITDFGIFIGLDGSIDGLVHLSDISWDEPGEQVIRKYKKGDEVEVTVLAIDPERERISLGIKQLQNDPFNNYAEANPKGAVVKGIVTEVEEKQAFVELAPEVKGRLKAGEIAAEKIADVRERYKVGDEVEARVISVNRKDRMIGLSIKAKDMEFSGKKKKGEKNESSSDSMVNPTLGDLFKEQMKGSSSSDAE